MRISGTTGPPALNLVGGLSSIKERKSNLIFVYPILFDKTLVKYWEPIIRDFQTAQFISQIKVSNILNITQKSITGYGNQSSANTINPAEVLNDALSNNNYAYHSAMRQRVDQINATQSNISSAPSSSEYAFKLNEFRSFIKQQVLTDPIYANLRPAFSLITLEKNLIDIPLIAGTKTYKIDTGALYWILFVALSNNETNFENAVQLNRILDSISRIPKNQYVELLYSSDVIRTPSIKDPTKLDRVYSSLRRESDQALQKAIRDFKTITTLNDFEADIGFGTSLSSKSAVFSDIFSSSIAEKAEMKSKITALSNQLIINSLFPVIQSVNNMIVNPAIEINFTIRYKKLIDNLSNYSSANADTLLNFIINKIVDRETNSELNAQDKFIVAIKNSCESLKSVRAADSLSKLNSLRLKYTHLRDAAMRNSHDSVVNFAEDLTNISAQLTASTNTIINMLENVTDQPISQVSDGFIRTTSNYFRMYFGPDRDDYNHAIFDVSLSDADPNSAVSDLFRNIFGGNFRRNHATKFIESVISSLAAIANFIFFYSTYSYICEFINIVSVKYEVKAQDAIEFPNYTLVIPIEYVETLYYALAAKNISDSIRNLSNPSHTPNSSLNRFKLSETVTVRLIDAIIERLNVKNLIVVDSNKKEIYYRWCFLKRTLKLNESTLRAYVKSQSNITSSF